MSNVRKIYRNPVENRKNYYLVDACFLANHFIDHSFAPDASQKERINRCNEWWEEIEKQLAADKARIYVPDICIAETFKVLAKKYYEDKWFKKHGQLNNARKRLGEFISTPPHALRTANRKIKIHDVSTTRDLIISVDRFYELFHKNTLSVSLPDLIILATAKYLMDFFDIPKTLLHIVTLDRNLSRGCKKLGELPMAYDPTQRNDFRDRVFAG